MKKLLCIALIYLMATYNATAQEDPTLPTLDPGSDAQQEDQTKARPNDKMVIGFYTNTFAQTLPSDIGFKYGFSGFSYTLYPYSKFIKETGFGTAVGIGVQTARYKTNISEWSAPILNTYTPEPKRAHLNTTQINIPIELRYTTLARKKDNALKIAAGLSVGYTIGANTFTQYGTLKTTQQGTPDLLNITKLNYALHARIAYAHVGVQAHYSLSSMFTQGAAAGLNAVALGVTFQ
jgi:hypothetical protein